MSDLLKNALILDTETLGLGRGSPIHELALYDFETRTAKEWILNPRAVVVTGGKTKQDVLRFSSRASDIHTAKEFSSWSDAIAFQIATESGTVSPSDVTMDHIRQTNSFLADSLEANKFPYLTGGVPSAAQLKERAQLFGREGITLEKMGRISPTEMISTLGQEIKGKTVWIANAAFESKQIGAQIGADIHYQQQYLEAETRYKQLMQQRDQLTQRLGKGNDDEIRRQIANIDKNPNITRYHDLKAKVNSSGNFKAAAALETFGSSPDALYVTGKEVNAARTQARVTGDWTKVYQAYKQYTPKAGETAVRDIQDVTKAMMSYGKKLGILNARDDVYFGTGIDITARLFGSTEDNASLAKLLFQTEEVHRAAEDAALSERYVLEKAVAFTDALDTVYNQKAGYEELLRQAHQGKGLLSQAADFFARLEAIGSELNRDAVRKRLGRAMTDMLKDGFTYQTNGIERIASMEQRNPLGSRVTVSRAVYGQTSFNNMEDYVDFLKSDSRYTDFGINIDAEYAQLREAVRGLGHEDAAKAIQSYTHNASKKTASVITADADRLLKVSGQSRLKGFLRPSSAAPLISEIASTFQGGSKAGKIFGAASMGLAAQGAIWSLSPMGAMGDTKNSILAYTYEDYAKAHAEHGLANQGFAKRDRKMNSDFGSPYQGDSTSSNILYLQQQYRDMQAVRNDKYAADHYDRDTGLFGRSGPYNVVKQYSRSFQGRRDNSIHTQNQLSNYMYENISEFAGSALSSAESSGLTLDSLATKISTSSSKHRFARTATYLLGAYNKTTGGGISSALGLGSKEFAEQANSSNFDEMLRRYSMTFSSKGSSSLDDVTMHQAGQFFDMPSASSIVADTMSPNKYSRQSRTPQPFMTQPNSVDWTSINQPVLTDLSRLMSTKGTNSNPNSLRNSYAKAQRNRDLIVDGMSSVKTSGKPKSPQDFSVHKRNLNIRRKLAVGQRAVNQDFGKSPINHHIM